nr:RNA-directed DNA polymerase, eukaryota [Tanacetum cinerariifolium]
MVEQAWNSFSHSDYNGLIRFKKKLQDKNLDTRNVSDEILLKRMELTRQLHDINQMEARDYVLKLKIKWAIEGDENSKFFHDVFKDHFATRFKQSAHGRLKLNISFPNRLSTDQVANMDRSVSRDEIRVAVWNCGEKRKKKQAMIFKVDIAKAYDSVSWDYLLDVLQAFGFGPNWAG